MGFNDLLKKLFGNKSQRGFKRNRALHSENKGYFART